MRFLIALSFVLFPAILPAQNYFEGKIFYKHSFEARSKKVNLKVLTESLGQGSTLSFKDGNFRHDYIGGMFEYDIYNRRENKLYMKERNKATIFWYDCSKGGKAIQDLKVSKNAKKVMGVLCDEMTAKYEDHSSVEYYNSDSIRTNPDWFANYRRNEQHKTDSIARSIFLRSELKYKALTIITEATSVERTIIDTGIFEIPLNAELVERK